MTLQTAYQLFPTRGVEGETSHTGGTLDIISIVNGSTVIPFGRVVSYDGTTGDLKLGLASADELAGIALSRSRVEGQTTDDHPANSTVPVLTAGRVWMRLAAGSVNAVVGQPVHVTRTTGTITATTTATATAPALADATFESAGTAGELVIVKL